MGNFLSRKKFINDHGLGISSELATPCIINLKNSLSLDVIMATSWMALKGIGSIPKLSRIISLENSMLFRLWKKHASKNS